jgi:ketosteroid isomerase-like protein
MMTGGLRDTPRVSHENLEIAEQALEAFNERDLDTLAELTIADFEFFPGTVGAVDGSSFRGRGELAAYFRELHDTWEEVRLVAEETRELGDVVLIFVRVDGRGRGSGVPVSAQQVLAYHFRGGKISRLRAYLNRDEALRDNGLSD